MSYPEASTKAGVIHVLGLNLHPVSVNEIHQFISEVIQHGEKALVLNLNINAVNLALKYEWFKQLINQSQLVFCDGDGVRWGMRLLGESIPPKVTYDRWILQLSDFCEKEQYRLFFLGGKPGIAALAAGKLKIKYPKLQILGVLDGYFQKRGLENKRIIAEINRQKPDILIVGFGMPLQEKWLSENWQKVDAHIFLTGGAVFDYVSGRAKRAPQWMIQANLEWLFRFIQEPRRLFSHYVFGIPYFFFRIFLEKMRGNKKR